MGNKSEKYTVIVYEGWTIHSHSVYTYKNFKEALNQYRLQRAIYGDNVRICKVVVDYGEEV